MEYNKAFSTTQIHHNIDGINIASDNIVHSDDSSIDDSDYDSDISNHEDIDDEQKDNEKQKGNENGRSGFLCQISIYHTSRD